MLKRLTLTVALLSFPCVAGFVDVKNNEISIKYKADGFMLVAKRSDEFERYGLGYGNKGRQYEVYYGVHDNLKPYVHGIYKVPTLPVQFGLSIESNHDELKRGYKTEFEMVYYTSENWGVMISLDSETVRYGVRKWF